MKLVAIIATLILAGCSTFNAAVDGSQNLVNKTVQATGEGVAGVTEAVGKDVTRVVDNTAQSAADGIRSLTTYE